MGVDTKAIIRKGVTIEQIANTLSEKYEGISVHATQTDFMYVIFKEGLNQRDLAVSFNNSCERDDGISGVWVSISSWGNSVGILRYLCETFGGYLDENDCDDKGYYPINFHLYQQGKEFTDLDLFKHKVITLFGYDKLKEAISLFESFSKVKFD